MHALTRTYIKPEISLLVVAVPECAAGRHSGTSGTTTSASDNRAAPLRRRVLWLDTFACSKMAAEQAALDETTTTSTTTSSNSGRPSSKTTDAAPSGPVGSHKSPYLSVLRPASAQSSAASSTRAETSFGVIAYANFVLCSEEAFNAFHSDENRDNLHTISSGEYDRNEFTGTP
jgi:hypothetical protein